MESPLRAGLWCRWHTGRPKAVNRCHPATADSELRQQYQVDRSAAWQAYLATAEGQAHFSRYEPQFRQFYQTVEPDRFLIAAREAALGKIERKHFSYSEFGIWLLERHQPTARSHARALVIAGLIDAPHSLFEDIEVFYNRQRSHSALGYLSPT